MKLLVRKINVAFPNTQLRIGPFLMEEGREVERKEGIIHKIVNRKVYITS